MKKIIILFIAMCCIMNLTTLNADAKTKKITLQEVKKQVKQNKLPYAIAKIGDPYKKFKGKKHVGLPYSQKLRSTGVNHYVYNKYKTQTKPPEQLSYLLKGKGKTNTSSNKVAALLFLQSTYYSPTQVKKVFGKPFTYERSESVDSYSYIIDNNMLVLVTTRVLDQEGTIFYLLPFTNLFDSNFQNALDVY